jgi:hypothetical protein
MLSKVARLTMGKGTLLFKGEAPKKKKKKIKHIHDDKVIALDVRKEEINPSIHEKSNITESVQIQQPKLVKGSGMITSSGSVVTGIGTKFESELGVGDAMIVELSEGQQEMRVVKMRLSNLSCGISSAFSQSVVTPTPYQIIRKPSNSEEEQRKRRQESQRMKAELEQSSFGTYRHTDELVFRRRTENGNYRIEKQSLDGERSRTELLEMRSKKTSDKYC